MDLKISCIFPLSGTTPKKGVVVTGLCTLEPLFTPNLNQSTLYRT